ncbi:MAG: hypothetical protein KGL93_08050, partial [Gemmatimonadota bacterium]|nr:hypothetical protein [Gemmatimonadota bacterium]
AWRAALDSARVLGADSLYEFGDSLRPAGRAPRPDDRASNADPVVQRALADGRPVVVITDGEIDGAAELRQLPSGSRVIVVPHARAADAAAAGLDVPRAVVAGDSAQLRLTVRAGAAGARAGTARFFLDDRLLGAAPFDTLAPYAEQDVTLRAVMGGPEGPAVARAVIASPGDVEPRNDTLAVGIDLSRQPGAVFVSTSPDYDARYALAVLRGALALPTRAFYHLSPGNWRVDGTYAPATEAEVREAFRDAPVAILHGDTAAFGPPRQATRAPLALIVPSAGDGSEWYASAAPMSPLSGALAELPWDSLPPLLVGPGPEAKGQWGALDARRGREALTRTIVAGDDAPRRVVIVAASDLWRWAFRGGASADAFTALWGSIFDYLASARADRRAAVPGAGVVRAGEPIAWRRGAAGDTAVSVVLQRAGAGAPDTLRLRFPGGAAVTHTAPLAAGRYDARVDGGAAVLVVNASRELVPRRPAAVSGRVGGAPPRGAPPGARDTGWLYVLLLAALCGEWFLRRRAGMR